MRELMSEKVKGWSRVHDDLWNRVFGFIVEQIRAGQCEYGA
jgi:hypothetical protein